MQTRRQSIVEAVINTIIAYFVSLVVQLTVFPLYGIHITLSANLQIVLIFTIISLVRNYIIRRFFNKRHTKPVAYHETGIEYHAVDSLYQDSPDGILKETK